MGVSLATVLTSILLEVLLDTGDGDGTKVGAVVRVGTIVTVGSGVGAGFCGEALGGG